MGFIRQWPALPRVVIFLSVCVLPTPHVPIEDRYVVNKTRTVEGFYGVTYYLGWRDSFDVEVGEITQRICSIEARDDPRESAAIISEIRKATAIFTPVVLVRVSTGSAAS
jgi:KUP system potassium uptake protein